MKDTICIEGVTMTAKTNKQRQAEFIARQKKEGKKEYRRYIKPEHFEPMDKHLDKLKGSGLCI